MGQSIVKPAHTAHSIYMATLNCDENNVISVQQG
jgi:hypothetical protein